MNKEIKRRTNVVDTSPNPAALLRLAGHVRLEQHDEWDSRAPLLQRKLHEAPARPRPERDPEGDNHRRNQLGLDSNN